MDGRTALALAATLAVGIAVGIAIAGPAAETLTEGPTDASEEEPEATETAHPGDERASGAGDEADTDTDTEVDAGDLEDTDEETTDESQPTNASEETDDEDPTPANTTARLTLEGPSHVVAETPESFGGRLTVDGQGQANRVLEVHVDGEVRTRAETNASGHYEAELVFTDPGEHGLQALFVNGSSELEVASHRLNVTVEVAFEPTEPSSEVPWAMYRGDVARTGARGTVGPGDGSTLWTLETELDVLGEPAVAGEQVFVATSGSSQSEEPTVYATNATTGEVAWAAQREHGFGSPVVHEDAVIVASGSSLLAYDREDGTHLWSADVGAAGTHPSPSLGPQAVYVLTDEGEDTALTAVDVASGEQRWSTELGGEPQVGSPALVDGTLYAALGSTLYALDAASGNVSWSFEAEGVLVAVPAVANGTVYTASASGVGTIYAVNASSGELAWTNTIHGSPADAIAVHDGRVYVASATEPWAYAFEAGSSAYVWNQTIESGALGGPAVTEGALFVADREGTVFALDPAEGTSLWTREILDAEQERIVSSPVVADGRLFVPIDDDCTGCTDAGLVALDAGEPVEG